MADINNLKNLLLDPTGIQSTAIDLLRDNSENGLSIPDPSNPFVYLLEFNSMVTTSAMEGINKNFRKAYPILSKKKEDLYNHLIEEELLDTFATPSECYFTFFINKLQIEKNGFTTNTFSEVLLPAKSTVSVSEHTFTLLNDVSIKLYKDNKVFILEKNDSSFISNNEDNIIYGGVVKDENNVEWVIFDLLVKQIDITYDKEDLIIDNIFNIDLELKDQFVFSEAYSINNKDGSRMRLSSTFSNFVFDSSTPTIKIKPLEDTVNYNLPSVYTINNLITGEIEIFQYSSKGDLNLVMDDFAVEDFDLSLNISTNNDIRISGLNNIAIFVKGKGSAFGGRNAIDFETLKDKVINHTTGDNTIPITNLEVKEEISKLGFSLLSTNDDIISRDFVVTKNIFLDNAQIPLYPEIFSNDIAINSGNIDNDYITKINNSIVMNPFLPIRMDNTTENMTILTRAEIEDYVNDYKKYDKTFFTIFKYILDFDTNASIRAYDVNIPTVAKISNVTTNNFLDSGISILDRKITRVKNNYNLTYIFTGNNLFTNLDINKVYGQISLDILISKKTIYYKNKITKNVDGTYEISILIESNGYINEDDEINLRNINLDLLNIYTALVNPITFLIFSTDVSLTNSLDILDTHILDEVGIGLYSESSELSLGKRLNHLYTKYDITYTDRKYKRYTEDIPMVYKENVYQLDENGIVVNYIDSDGDGTADTAVPVVLHLKGETVLDVNNEPILLHNKNDIILDSLGNPTIDTDLGLIHRVNLLHLDYIYRLNLANVYSDYLLELYKKISDTVSIELNNINKSLLDNTKLVYKPINSGRDLYLMNNGIKVKNKNFVNPIVKIYVSDSVVNNLNYNFINVTNIISKTLQVDLLLRKNINDIEEEIKYLLGDEVIAIKILGLDSIGDLSIKKYINSDNIILNNVVTKGLDGNKYIIANLEITILEI